MTLKTLADVRVLIERHLPEDRRERHTFIGRALVVLRFLKPETGRFSKKTGRRLSTNLAIAERDQGLRSISPKANNREKQGGKQGDLSLWKEKRGDVPLLRPNLPAPPAPTDLPGRRRQQPDRQSRSSDRFTVLSLLFAFGEIDLSP
jgi:hypothetical protein